MLRKQYRIVGLGRNLWIITSTGKRKKVVQQKLQRKINSVLYQLYLSPEITKFSGIIYQDRKESLLLYAEIFHRTSSSSGQVALLLPIREFPGSNLTWTATILTNFLDSSSIPPGKFRDSTSNRAVTSSLHIFPNSVSDTHPIIHRHISLVSATTSIFQHIINNSINTTFTLVLFRSGFSISGRRAEVWFPSSSDDLFIVLHFCLNISW